MPGVPAAVVGIGRWRRAGADVRNNHVELSWTGRQRQGLRHRGVSAAESKSRQVAEVLVDYLADREALLV